MGNMREPWIAPAAEGCHHPEIVLSTTVASNGPTGAFCTSLPTPIVDDPPPAHPPFYYAGLKLVRTFNKSFEIA